MGYIADYLNALTPGSVEWNEVMRSIRNLSGEVPEYTGCVGNRGCVSDTIFGAGGQKQAMTLQYFTAMDDVVAPQLLTPMGMSISSSNVEVIQTGAMLQEASLVDLSDGTIGRFQWSGQNQWSGNAGDVPLNDPNPLIRLRKGRRYGIRKWEQGANGLAYTGTWPYMTGEGAVLSAGTTTPNLVDGGAVTQSAGFMLPVMAVIGKTTRRSVFMIPDSIDTIKSTVDVGARGNGLAGGAARAIGQVRAFSDMGRASINSGQFTLANAPRRLAAAQYFTDLLSMIGRNDSYASVVANLTAMFNLSAFASLRKFQATIQVTASGSAVLLDGSDQTAGSNNASLITVNGVIRNGLNGIVHGVIDTSDATEFSRGSGKFKPGMAFEAGPGTDVLIHPNNLGQQARAMAYGWSAVVNG